MRRHVLLALHWDQHNNDEQFTPLEETLEALDEQVKAGKIRHIGLSNETPWATMNCLTEALGLALPGNGSALATHSDRVAV